MSASLETVKVHYEGRVIACARGTLLRDVLLGAGLSPHNGRAHFINCRGLGTCGTCAVAVEGPLSPAGIVERWRLDFPPHKKGSGLRLACQIAVEADLVVRKHAGFWGEKAEAELFNEVTMSVPKKYESIDFKPPKKVAELAERGLALRREFERGGTKIGVARARDLKNRANLSPETVDRMVSYFARHEVDKKAKGFGDDDDPSAGYIAWLLWGGDAGKEWAESIKGQMERADEDDS